MLEQTYPAGLHDLPGLLRRAAEAIESGHSQARRPAYGSIRQRVLKLLRSTPSGVTASEIRLETGFSTDQVYTALRLLKRQQLVDNQRGVYRLLPPPTQEE